ncbi:MAG: GNAT family N-acetyltransferase [Euryarchaeota archaeon]|nr:GNAT family N-acetyltransferase [Euryarchaeota archaeon]MDE1835311.1 GNAT family N-acetyltransferase [Euryarchaeota archaeon]MDE1880582.1 GNAT family N-acetyltransferase [Euryarchaeota archaeon]MDE2043607.1 GNAT family N-acetyltransferase [Thermoplasmata archaeon]
MASASELTFRVATEADLAVVLGLLTEAAEWAHERGIERWWPAPFPESWVLPSIERREVVVASWRGEVVGRLTLTREDPRMWGERPPEAGYVHRLAVRRELAHRELGGALLSYAENEVRRWGRSKLRLDVSATNLDLIRYYLRKGFHEVGRVTGGAPAGIFASLLMEKEIEGTSRR